MANRSQLKQLAGLPDEPVWLNQQHSVTLLDLDSVAEADVKRLPAIADAAWTQQSHRVAAVLTADCLPILVTNRKGTMVCAIHAGWRGLLNGIVRNTLQQLPEDPAKLLVWIGPAIRQAHFEVGEEVFRAFVDLRFSNNTFFEAGETDGKYWADLPGLAKAELQAHGVYDVYDSGLCSYSDSDRFFSYRREGVTGRMASLIWISPEA